jgi:arylformamidase
MGIVDLSHVIEDGMITYPGLPGPYICDFLSREDSRERYAPGTQFQIGKIEMVSNTGTYLDCPFHRYADGEDLAQVGLERLVALPGIVVRSSAQGIGPEAFADADVRGHAVLVHTGWDEHWRTERYGVESPYLTGDAAHDLRDRGVALVGIDSVNIDDMADGTRPVHTILLGAGIPIVEHLTGLGNLPDTGFRFSAAPPKVQGMGTFPVRAFAEMD